MHRPRWVLPAVALALVGMVLATILVVPRVYRSHKRKRGEKTALVARAAIDRGDWQAAGQSVLMATRLAPESPVVLREAARLTTIMGHPSAGQYWGLLFERTEPTRADRVMFSGLMLRIRRTDLIRPHLVALLKKDPRDAEAMELALVMFMEEGRAKESLLAARTIADEFPERPGAELHLARTLLAVGRKDRRDEARHLLWSRAFRPKPDAFAAIAELSRMPEVSTDELRMLLRRVPETETNALYRLLVESNIRFRLDPNAERSEAGQAVVDAVGRKSPAAERIVAIDWLIANDRPSDALRIATQPWIRTNAVILQRRLQALAVLDRWDEIRQRVEDRATILDPVTQRLYRAVIANHGKHPTEAVMHLSAALAIPGSGPDELQSIAAYAEALDQPKIAALALQPLLSNPTLAPITGPRILGLLSRVDTVPPMLQAIERLLAIDPANDALRNDQSWLRLLVEDRTQETLEAAVQMSRKHPEDARFLATEALGWLKSNHPEKAYELLDAHAFGGTNSPVRARLVHCAAMGAVGRRDGARRLAREIEPNKLRSEERVLVQEWLD